MAAMDFFNRDPVVHTWTYKLDKAADMIRTSKSMTGSSLVPSEPIAISDVM
jgi:hypothetical protein